MTLTADTAPTLEIVGPEPADLAGIPTPGAEDDKPTTPPRRSRSGTSGAERKRRAAASGDRAPRGAAAGKPSQEKQLAEGFAGIAELLAFLDPYDAAWLTHNGPKVAHTLATSYPKLAELLLKFLAIFTGDAGGFVLLIGVAIPPLVHHGIIPPQFAGYASMGTRLLGTEPPAALVEKHAEARQQLAQAAAMMAAMNAAGAGGAGEAPPASAAA